MQNFHSTRPRQKSSPHDAESIGAAMMVTERRETLRRSSWKQVPGWDRHGPPRVNGGEVFDHRYTLCDGEGRKKYVSEPYQIAEDGIRELLEIQQRGWTIEIKAGNALHFPGHTVAITFEREENL